MSVSQSPARPSSHGVAPAASLLTLMRSPLRQTPVLAAILAVNGLVFLAMLAAGSGLWHTANGVPLAWGANFGPATQDGQWWRLVSAMFVHFGVLHLCMNMWALWDVGRLMERLLGWWRMAALYLGSGVLGNLVSLAVQGNQAVSGGASGAVFSLYGALLVFLWRERQQVESFEFRWLFGTALVFIALILGLGFFIPGIDNAAHGGGLVAGALLGTVIGRAWTPGSPAVRGRGLALVALVLGVAAVVWKLPEPAYRFSEEVKAQTAIAEFLVADRRINQQWEGLLSAGRGNTTPFAQWSSGADTRVADGYERSFERLMEATPQSDAPSAERLTELQRYARQRADAAKGLADGLRARDPMRIRQAVEQAQDALGAVRGHTPGAAQSPQPPKTPQTSSSAP